MWRAVSGDQLEVGNVLEGPVEEGCVTVEDLRCVLQHR
jgi:hypothetical protein